MVVTALSPGWRKQFIRRLLLLLILTCIISLQWLPYRATRLLSILLLHARMVGRTTPLPPLTPPRPKFLAQKLLEDTETHPPYLTRDGISLSLILRLALFLPYPWSPFPNR